MKRKKLREEEKVEGGKREEVGKRRTVEKILLNDRTKVEIENLERCVHTRKKEID